MRLVWSKCSVANVHCTSKYSVANVHCTSKYSVDTVHCTYIESKYSVDTVHCTYSVATVHCTIHVVSFIVGGRQLEELLKNPENVTKLTGHRPERKTAGRVRVLQNVDAPRFTENTVQSISAKIIIVSTNSITPVKVSHSD